MTMEDECQPAAELVHRIEGDFKNIFFQDA
jgi:hypothetical protein